MKTVSQTGRISSLVLYRNGTELVNVTDKSPRQFQGVLFRCLRGTLPENVVEGVISPNQCQGWEKIDADTLSPEWRSALELPALASKPKAKPAVPQRAVRRHKPLQRQPDEEPARSSSPYGDMWDTYKEYAPICLIAIPVFGVGIIMLVGLTAGFFGGAVAYSINERFFQEAQP